MRAIGALAIALAVGCGGARAPAAPAAPGEGDDCEPGRCLAHISELIEQNRPAARACYEAGHQRDPSLQGRIIINFEIDPSGTVVDASQSSQDGQITDEETVTCVAGVIKDIQFAASKRGKSTKAFHRYEFNPP